MNEQSDTSSHLLQRLEDSLESFTASERKIANFILMHRGGIAFETAHSLAEKLQVSSITVGRFSRKMGFRHFKDLKAGLRMTMSGVPWLVGDQVTDFIGNHGASERGKRSLELELAGIIEVYAIAETDGWKEIVELLARSEHVHVAGFQTERGVATTLANLLQYAREGVSSLDCAAGHYHDLFATSSKSHCLVLVDMRRYSEQAYALAEQAHMEGIPIIMITDKFCDWIRKFSRHVIAVPTEVDLFWSSQVSLSCAVNLLVNDVIGTLGRQVEQRLERLSDLYQTHVGHVSNSARKRPRRQ